jgi:hydroxyacylglutathione hydrolase
MKAHIRTLLCGDNFISICRFDASSVFVVDPTSPSPVLDALHEGNLTLAAVLVTHHHGDHTAGVSRLKATTGCEVIGPDRQRIAGIDRFVKDGDIVTFGDCRVEVLGTPGHTRTSVCYHLRPSVPNNPGVLWTGDTLFFGGCGRPMECDSTTLWTSLTRLAALPDETLIYCSHEYTVENYEFALTIEPDHPLITEQLVRARQTVVKKRPTGPSTVAQEKATNIFLRAGEPAVRRALGMETAASEQVFAELRERKNRFG